MSFAQVGAFHKKDLFSLIGDFDTSYKIVGDFDFYLRAKEIIKPCYVPICNAKMMNTGISNQAYIALKEAYELKNKYKLNNKYINLFDFYFRGLEFSPVRERRSYLSNLFDKSNKKEFKRALF